MKDVGQLQQEELELERRLDEVRSQLTVARQRRGPARPKSGAARPAERRPLRELVLDVLNDAGAPLNSLLIASVFRPVYKRDVPSTRFGTLSADEQRSFDSTRPRPVYLCHCLTHDRGQAMKRFWARSDWPLEERLIGPMTGRVLFLKGATWIIRLAQTAGEGTDADQLRFVAADQARDAGCQVKRGEFPFNDWITQIQGQIERYFADDRAVRLGASAELAARLDERALLFGAPGELISIPGTSTRWSKKTS
jgi:hypothetical protein